MLTSAADQPRRNPVTAEQDRKLEIQRKKQRLEQLRNARMKRGELSSALDLSGLATSHSYTAPLSTSKEVEELVNSLIGPPAKAAKDTGQAVIAPENQDKPPRPNLKLQMDTVQLVDFSPEEKIVYSKEMQTDPTEAATVTDPTDEPAAKDLDHGQAIGDPLAVAAAPVEEREPTPAPETPSPNEASILVTTDAFQSFFERATKIVERALNEDYDIFTDYSIKQHDTKSPTFPELLLASYNKNTSNSNEPDGLVLVWNIHMPTRPEYILFAQSDVTMAKFSPFHPSIVVGGTYSGQVLVWDTSAKNTPILSTSLSLPGHSHPVYCISIVGSHNAHNLITASTDGVVCSWQLDILASPQELTELVVHRDNGRSDEVAVTSMAFQKSESSIFLVGTAEGSIYQVNRFDRAASKAGIEQNLVYRGHDGSVTGLQCHPLVSNETSQLFLSCSVDWSIKLWKSQTQANIAASGTITPLKSFDSAQDYVADVAWSPTHPAVFASIDGSGNLDLYNLNENPDSMVSRLTVPHDRGLNKLAWSKSGETIALAALDGTVYLYEVGHLVASHPDDQSRFANTVRDFTENI
ncbi:hypothetical protein HDV03_001119 [Kappamyces sp. JEL0829]|nr:hypothetical protein HDV03_001119 [Kappamyces sp. JEL0829]